MEELPNYQKNPKDPFLFFRVCKYSGLDPSILVIITTYVVCIRTSLSVWGLRCHHDKLCSSTELCGDGKTSMDYESISVNTLRSVFRVEDFILIGTRTSDNYRLKRYSEAM